MARRKRTAAYSDEHVAEFPGTVVIDTREQLGYGFASVTHDPESDTDDVSENYTPFDFTSIPADLANGGGLLRIPTVVDTLPSGDYSLRGHETRVAVERKSISDLFRTIGQERRRFVDELERLSEYVIAYVVVEAEWSEILSGPPRHSKLRPLTIHRSVTAWEQRYPRVHWRMMPGRSYAEVVTIRILQRYMSETQAKVKDNES